MAEHFPTACEIEEQYTHGREDFVINKRNCDCRINVNDHIPKMALQVISDSLSIVASCGDDIYEIAEAAVTEPESIVVHINSEPSQAASIAQEGNDGNSMINIDQTVENVPTHHKIVVQLIARAIWIVGLLTVIVDGRTALSKPASGVFFGHNKLAYYGTLAVIFYLGVAELFTSVWISMSMLTYICRLWIGGAVLFLSIWPFVGILSIGGLV